MTPTSLFRSIFKRSQAARTANKGNQSHLGIEQLEERCLLSTATPLVIGDNSKGFSETGKGWTGTSWLSGYNGEGLQYTNTKPGNASAKWNASGVVAGSYVIQVDWNGSALNTGAAVYSIYDGNTLVKTVSVNQQLSPSGPSFGGVAFQTLATVPINSGSIRVVLVSQAAGDLMADALRIAPTTDSAPVVTTSGPYAAATGSAITFGANVSDATPGAGTAGFTYVWNFGDGTNSTLAVPTHAYATAGIYAVQLTVTSNLDGLTGSTTTTANITATTPLAQVFDGSTAIADGTGSDGFGSTVVGTPVSKTFTVKNAGTAPLTLGPSITLTSGFTLSAGFGSTTLAAGASTTFTVQMTAAAAGSYSGTLSFTTNDTVNSPYTFTITGTATAPLAQVYDGSTAIADGSGSDGFGSTAVGTPVSKTFTVKNAGTAPLTLGPSITMPSGFTLSAGFGSTTLAAGASTTFTVQMTAATAGSYSGSLSFTTNDTVNSPYTFTITGTATSADVPPTVTTSGPYSGSTGSAISFSATVTDATPGATAAGFTYLWNFGDGSTSTASAPTHAYATAGTYNVQLTVTANLDRLTATTSTTAVVSGAVGSGGGTAVIIDDGQAGFSETGPGWTGYGTGYNGEQQYTFAAPGAASASWKLTGLANNTYIVQADWNGSPSHTAAAVYQIYDGNTLVQTVTVNQQADSSGTSYSGVSFQTLASVQVSSGTLTVVVTNQGSQALIADAVCIAPPTPDVTVAQMAAESSVNAGSETAFTITLTNSGTGSASGVTLSDPLPGGNGNDIIWQIGTTTGNPSSFILSGSVGNQVLGLAPNTSLAVGASLSVNVTGIPSTVTDAGILSNTATVSAANEPAANQNQQATASVTVSGADYNAFITTPYLNIPNFGAHPTIVNVQSGNWSNPATWSLGRVPQAGDIVDIVPNTTVTYDVNDTGDAAPLNTVEIQPTATLTFSTTSSTEMYVVNLVVLQGGTLDIGTQASPIPSTVTATVIWVNQALNTALDPEQYGNGLIALGTVNTYGAIKVPYVTLSQEAHAGDTVLHLASSAAGWQVGDRLQLPDTRQLDGSDNLSNYAPQWETATIQSISADGLSVTLTAPLQYNHLGAHDAKGAVAYLPQVVDTTRNVSIHSQSATGTRGYALFTGQANVNINYTSFGGMGRTTDAEFLNSNFAQLFDNTTFDSNGNVTHLGTDEQNRNAVTFLNLFGPVTPQPDGYQFTFNGNVVTCPLTPMPYIWGLNVVNSYYGLIQNNDVVNWAGAGVMVDSASSYNMISGNFVMRVNGTGWRGSGDLGFAGDGFWFGNSNNYVTNDVVADLATNGPYGYAYEFYSLNMTNSEGIGDVSIAAYQGADPSQPGQSVTVNMNAIPLLAFANDEAYGAAPIGLSYWSINDTGDGSTAPLADGGVISNFVVWNLWVTGIYGYPANNVTIDGFVDIGDANEVALGNGATGIQFSDYLAGNLVIQNSNIQNQAVGVMVPVHVSGPTTISNSYFADLVGIDVPGMWTVNYTCQGIGPRNTLISNDQFASPFGAPSFTSIKMDWFQQFQLESGKENLVQLDTVLVTSYDGVAGDNFQLYYTQQAANFVVPQTVLNTDGTPQITGAPVAGLTNAQLYAQYGIAIAGAVAPLSAVTMANIDGLVEPI